MNDITLTAVPDHELFARIGDYLEKELHVVFITKLSGIDQSYWDFKLNDHPITLHLEHYSGICLIVSRSKPTSETIRMAHFIANMIRKKFHL